MRCLSLSMLFAMSFTLLATPARANHWDLFLQLCPFQIPEIPLLIERFKIPVGCEVVDCCPGCPGGDRIEWRIRVEGSPLTQRVALRFDGLSADELKRLEVTGAKLSQDGMLVLDATSASVRGLPRTRKGRMPSATLIADSPKTALSHGLDAASERDADSRSQGGQGRIVIEQLLGGFVVNTFGVRFGVRPCRRPSTVADRITLQNNTGGDNAVILYDARETAGCRDDIIVRTATTSPIDNALTNGACGSEVSVFSDDDAMSFQVPVTTWTDPPGDVHTVALAPILTVPVNVWVATAGAVPRATNDLANANLLYNINNVGVQFVPVITDVSTNAGAVAAIGTDCDDAATAQGSAFYVANQLNVYYTGGNFTGVNCNLDRNINYIGTIGNLASLAHEIGHAYGLRPSGSWGHTNDVAGFGNNNVMWGGGPATRDHFSVGQAFRLNVHTGSMLNANGNRVGTTRDCAPNVTSTTCPALGLDSLPH